jgi:predicted PurR-regulated permease PerM
MSPFAEPVKMPTLSATSQIKKRRIPKWLKIVGVIIAVIIVAIIAIVIVVSTATAAPQKVSDQFVAAIQSHNTNAAYALTSDRFQRSTPQQDLDSLLTKVSPALQGQETITGRSIGASTVTVQTAVFVYTIKTSTGNAYIKTELQKSGDVWQIINFKVDSNPLNTTIE